MRLLSLPRNLADLAAERFFRPELKIRTDITDREMRFMNENNQRFNWIIANTYLTPGGLEDLRRHPDYHPFDAGFIFVYYASNSGQKPERHKKVRINFTTEDSDPTAYFNTLERQLKFELHIRGANAGVYYRSYRKGSLVIAEAVPARLDCE